MSNQALSQILVIQKRLNQQRDQLRKRERELEKEIDSQAIRLHFRDASKAKDELRELKRKIKEAERKCLECNVWLREANSSDPLKQQTALNRAQKL